MKIPPYTSQSTCAIKLPEISEEQPAASTSSRSLKRPKYTPPVSPSNQETPRLESFHLPKDKWPAPVSISPPTQPMFTIGDDKTSFLYLNSAPPAPLASSPTSATPLLLTGISCSRTYGAGINGPLIGSTVGAMLGALLGTVGIVYGVYACIPAGPFTNRNVDLGVPLIASSAILVPILSSVLGSYLTAFLLR